MSGHNPHSRLSQPVNSSSWNHLQVPYARQPQLAHMSNDRTLRSSPLIWPNTNPADAFYNYMALTAAAVANSNPKNSLDINPLLPFVRAPTNSMPFNSVDLSLPSSAAAPIAHANRNSLTPSPRTQHSPGLGSLSSSSNNRFLKHQNDNDDGISANNGANKMNNHNKLNTDPIAFLNEMSEQLASMRSNRNLTASANFARDSSNLNSDLSNFRNNGGNDKLQQRTEPMELVKEHPNPFENESLSQSVHLQQLLGLAVQTQPPLPPPPSTTSSITSITPNLNDLTKMLSIINNTTSPTSPSTPSSSSSSSANYASRQCTDTPSKNCLSTSNDDSLDSQPTSCNGNGNGGTDNASVKPSPRYRRRKQQKTIRMSNELNETDPITGPLENDRTNAMKHEQSKHDTAHSNGLNFPTFHSDGNSILTSTSSIGMPPPPPQQTQTHSMDLSHHCGNAELFENGLINYNKSNTSLDLTHVANTSTNTTNLMPTDEISSLNLFGSVNFGHLRGTTNLTNDIATFPNTDDLVKKVEELVKCNEQNGFATSLGFGPAELIKSQTNKLTPETYESARMSNGLLDSMKMSTNNEHLNNHVEAPKHNGNGLLTSIAPSINQHATIENKLNQNNHDGIDTNKTKDTLSNGAHIDLSTSNRNGGSKTTAHLDETQSNTSHAIDSVMSSEFASINPANDMMYEKLSEEITKNQSNLNRNFVANSPRQTNSPNYNTNNELTKATSSTSSSDASPSNPSSTSASIAATATATATATTTFTSNKPKTNNPTNKKNANSSARSNTNKAGNKSNAGKRNNQKNAKSKEKSDKKSDINEKKKSKLSMDESATASTSSSSTATAETLNKFRGPYVHVSRDGTLEVINAPLNEEVSEKQSKFKKSFISQRPTDRNRIRGLHVSTLSNKYDAITTDISWMCVFCKLGPHKYGLGDLFGPFILSTEDGDFQLAQIDPKDDVFGRHHKLSASATKSTPGNVSIRKKRKFNQTDTEAIPSHSSVSIPIENAEVDIFYGMTRASDNSYEVWAHEDCLVWASGVHIIGARVVGLESAVWGSVRHQCGVCKQFGAMLSCLHRSCADEVHVPCAKRNNWNLNELTFQSRCSEHGNNTLQNDEKTNDNQ